MAGIRIYTIIRKNDNFTYETRDDQFNDEEWERSLDDYETLESLMKADPEKFKNCYIEDNSINPGKKFW